MSLPGCGVDMFKCDSGRCIPISLFCDFHDHCGDGSDETMCGKEAVPPPSPILQFASTLVSHAASIGYKGWQLVAEPFTFPFAPNVSELEVCNQTQFRCASGQCVPAVARCDFQTDCVDGSDEDSATCGNVFLSHSDNKTRKEERLP